MKILVPVDGSEYSKKLLAWLSSNADWLSGEHRYTLLHVSGAVPPRAAAVLDKQLLNDHYAEQAEKVFKPMRSFFAKKGLAVEFKALVGTAAEQIARLADKGSYDLVVMGSHGHGALATVVLGSVTNQVLARSKVPLLIIR